MSDNPYRDLDDYCFWSRAMSAPAPGQIDPVVAGKLIGPDDRIATMGSCFAQHLSAHLQASGLHYFVTEPPPAGLDAKAARARNFGVFSARYGNVYTIRQALQLFDRAFGAFTPVDDVWQSGSGYVDAFRPRVEPAPLASAEAVRDAVSPHLAAVRRLFTECDWLVFTLGLTEGWRSRRDGAVYPLAPGVSGGRFDPAEHEFVNFSCREIVEDLAALVERVAGVNPSAEILLTVSPVPLIATYERRHVLVSTTYSKAALRVAADEIERRFANVTYFPAYEIITSPAAGGRYYADDLRQVTELGVKHVMRVFSRHFVAGEPAVQPSTAAIGALADGDERVVCDEETIARALQDWQRRG